MQQSSDLLVILTFLPAYLQSCTPQLHCKSLFNNAIRIYSMMAFGGAECS